MARGILLVLALFTAYTTVAVGQKVLSAPISGPSPTVGVLPTPTTLPTQTPTSTPSPTFLPPTKTPTPTIVVLPTPKLSSSQIYELTNTYGYYYHVDPNIIRHIAICESGFSSVAQNGQYAGMFQFSVPTWESYRQKMNQDPNPNLRFDPEAAIETTAYILSQDPSAVNNWPNCRP